MPLRRSASLCCVASAIGMVLAGPGCRITSHATEFYEPAVVRPAPSGWDAVLAEPHEVEVRTEVTAQWEASSKGLVNLKHEKAVAAGLKKEKVPISIIVGVISHPDAGDFLVDSGINQDLANGKRGAIRGLVGAVAGSMKPLESTANLVERLDLSVSGVLLTHSHFDHIMGLPDLPSEVPVYIGPGEFDQRRPGNGLLRPTTNRLLADRVAAREFDPQSAIELDPFPAVIDLLGDGSIWGIVCEGHTRGSMAYLVNATDGPVLFVGDTSHTRWGWDNGVEPGTFTHDQGLNAQSLERLRTFVERYPQTKVVLGHQL